ncbi:uncharacterized protein LOC136076853 isoform X2 [Hydra vulgaris]
MRKKYKEMKKSGIYGNNEVRHEKLRNRRTVLLSDASPYLVDVESRYQNYTKNETLYAEVFVSCDSRMLNYMKKTSRLIERVLNAYFQLDRAYQAIDVRIVVVAIDIQIDAYAFTRYVDDSGKDLDSFKYYIDNVIKKTSPFKNVVFDVAMFLSFNRWPDGVVGIAYIDSICGEYSINDNYFEFDNISATVHTIGHEFGHILGFNHDEDKCDGPVICLTRRGCFMENQDKSSRPGFSNCSMEVFKTKEYTCLTNLPFEPYAKVCGNGILEKDEQCDCGTIEMCERNGDNCCEPLDCVFKASAQCSYKNNPDCCLPSCLFKKQGTLCREADGECDLPEYCEGDKATCPDNKSVQNVVPCDFSAKIFHGITEDTYNSVTNSVSRLSPPITAQHLNVLPKLWNKEGLCLKLKFFGCSSEEDCDLQLTKELPISAFDASSTFDEVDNTTSEELISRNGWCPKDPIGSWLKIDFGKKVNIKLIEMKITYLYTTWYTLQYSEDGQSWEDYLEKDADKLKKSKSVCFSGSCQLPIAKQCKTLPHLDGALCAENKLCVNEKCGSAKEHGFKCPMNAGKMCSGNGACTSDGTCVCNKGYSQIDNCLTKLKPVNGKWSEWSNYTKCSKDCNGGIQKRYRFCSNPVPKYGGKECYGVSSSERTCNDILCPIKIAPNIATRITTSDDKFCIEPKTGDCSVPDDTVLVFRSTSSKYCKNNVSEFIFNPKTGSLLHKCSNKFVCSESGIYSGSNMVVSSACNKSEGQIQRTIWKTLQVDMLCFNPSNSNLASGANIKLRNCDKENQILMLELDMGDVTVLFYKNVEDMRALKQDLNIPTYKGFVDNFDFSSYYIDHANIRMYAYFRVPESGYYIFQVACSGICELLFTDDISDSESAKKIAGCPKPVYRYEYDAYKEQVSNIINLKIANLYYLEIILVNHVFILPHASAAVVLPSGSSVAPISYEYLSRKN